MLKDKIKTVITRVLDKLGKDYPFKVEIPPEGFGDFSTNVALVGAKHFKKSPKDVAEILVSELKAETIFEEISVAGPGFINFKISRTALLDVLKEILNNKESFGRSDLGGQVKIQFEYGSANPTGPLTVAHGRQIVIGDVLVNVFKELGYDVKNEVYFNDAGKQISLLGRSLWVRYNELFGKKYDIPEGGYKGDYLIDVAKKLKDEIGDRYLDKWNKEVEEFFKNYAVENMKASMIRTFGILGSKFDNFFSEKSLIENGTVDEIIRIFREKDLVYEKDGALWFRVSKFVNEDDKVLIRSDGTPTYFLTDIAYHYDKYRRNFERVYDIWGSDHQGHIPRMKAGMKALDLPDDFFNVIIHQYVILKKDGKLLKMSTREGKFVTLDELIEKVGVDAVRYFFARIDPSTHLVFDMDLAVKRSMENPVYYVQYAHARVCSLFKQLEQKGLKYEPLKYIEHLGNEDERKLIKTLSLYPDVLKEIHTTFSPSKLTNYLEELAHDFHQFYTKNTIIDIKDPEISSARLDLSEAVRIVIKKGLNILGVSAPERM